MAGAIFDKSISQNKPAAVIFLYFVIAFFGQLGPGVTTYIMAAETYPTELRATCHGLSAFMGKAGALLATIVFNNKSTKEIFLICGGASVIGVIVTLLFSVDLTRVSLTEHETQLELFLAGRLDDYKGKLNARKHLSRIEIWFGLNGEYDPNWVESEEVMETGSKLLGDKTEGMDAICEED